MNTKPNKKSQGVKGKAIRQWLLSGRPLTQLEATLNYNYLRLGALVYDMRKEGIPIKTIKVEQEDGGAYARYILDSSYIKDDRQLSLFDKNGNPT